ncbi:MAG: D-2-hydroxyacid dehydrogenase [Chloroflexi bacterium]|nr:D-2-hydroxyacid dehydrogenase [Chloroflexota bacterium]
MNGPVNVVVAFKVAPEVLAEIEQVDPRVRVSMHPVLSAASRYVGSGAGSDSERMAAFAALAEAQVIFGPAQLTGDVFDAAPMLQWFQVLTAGVDRLAKEGVIDRGFPVTTVSGLAAPAIAEWALGGMIMLAKGMHTSVRDQAEHRWSFRFTGELSGKTLGIAGMGAIGRETARRARAFGMRVLATRRTVEAGAADPDCDEILPYAALDRLLAESDYLVLCVPYTPDTHSLIGAAELARMKPTACLLNVARGPVVDQEALIAALRDGTIAGAALDVTDPEPLPAESPLWDLPNVIITPHISGAVEGYGHRAAGIFIANLRHFLAGEPLENLVKPGLGY